MDEWERLERAEHNEGEIGGDAFYALALHLIPRSPQLRAVEKAARKVAACECTLVVVHRHHGSTVADCGVCAVCESRAALKALD